LQFFFGYLFSKKEPQKRTARPYSIGKATEIPPPDFSSKVTENLTANIKEALGIAELKPCKYIDLNLGRVYISNGDLILEMEPA